MHSRQTTAGYVTLVCLQTRHLSGFLTNDMERIALAGPGPSYLWDLGAWQFSCSDPTHWAISIPMECSDGRRYPSFCPQEDADMHKVAKGGFWYAFDDNQSPVLGPSASREECVRAIKSGAKEHRAKETVKGKGAVA